jgi:hypothetical protein
MPRTTRSQPAISYEGLEDLAAWFNEASQHAYRSHAPAPDHTRLTRHLPQGRIRSAAIRQGEHVPYVEAIILDHRTGEPRGPRLFDLWCFLLLRLLLAGKADIRMERNTRHGHYIGLFAEHIQLHRIIADAPSGVIVRQINKSEHGYRDLQRSNFYWASAATEREAGRPSKRAHQGRALAIEIAVKNFKDAKASGALQHFMDWRDYEMLLNQGFKYLDLAPLGEHPDGPRATRGGKCSGE